MSISRLWIIVHAYVDLQNVILIEIEHFSLPESNLMFLDSVEKQTHTHIHGLIPLTDSYTDIHTSVTYAFLYTLYVDR